MNLKIIWRNFNINLDLVKKISIEIAWNDYIFTKYNKLVQIDEKNKK